MVLISYIIYAGDWHGYQLCSRKRSRLSRD